MSVKQITIDTGNPQYTCTIVSIYHWLQLA